MKRAARPVLSSAGETALTCYEQRLRLEEDLSAITIRNYLSDLRQFIAWCESIWQNGHEEEISFTPEAVATPTLTNYRTYLQQTLLLKPNSVNRSLISLKRYFAWLVSPADANRYAEELREMLLDASPDVRVERKREHSSTQDFGATLILILGTPAAVAAAKAIGNWLALRKATITIEKENGEITKITGTNLTNEMLLKILELLAKK